MGSNPTPSAKIWRSVPGTSLAVYSEDIVNTLAVKGLGPGSTDSDAPQEKLDQLIKLTERYCVVYHTIRGGVPVDVRMSRAE